MRKEEQLLADDELVSIVKEATGRDISIVPAESLSPKHKQIAAAGEKLGSRVKFYDGPPELHGFHSDGTTFLNRKSEIPLNWVFWHESFHWMRNNNIKLYNEMLDYFKGKDGFSKKQINKYKEEIGRPELSDDQAIEEMLADYMPDVARRVKLMKELGNDNPSLSEKIVAWIRDMMDRFHEFFTTPAHGLSPSQKRNVIEAFTNLARDMVDADGKRIFIIDGKTIKLRHNRQPASSVLRNDAAIAYSAEGQSPRFASEAEIRKFIDFAVQHRGKNYEFPIGKVSAAEAVAIEKQTGLDVSGYEHVLRSNDVKHIQNRHGVNSEKSPSQEGLNEENMIEALRAIESPDEIKKGSPATTGEPSIRFMKKDGKNGQYTVVEVVRSNKKKLIVKTMWKKILAKHHDGEAVLLDTSETAGNTSSSIISSSISRKASDMQEAEKDDILYSLSNKDSIKAKIGNVFSSGRANVDISRQKIMQSLADLGKIKIASGKLSGEEAVVFKEIEKVIRAKRAYDWENLLPKVGQAIAKQLNISDKEPMQNYIADWFLTGATNNTSKESREFAVAMKKHPEFADKMMETQEMFQEWNSLDATERAKRIISWDKPGTDKKSLLTKTIHKLHDQFFEELGPIKRMVADIEKRTSTHLNAAGDPYVALRLFRGHFGKAMAMVEGGDRAVMALRNVFPSIDFHDFKTVNMILRDAGVLRDKEKMKDFMTFATVKHTKDIHEYNRTKAEQIENKIRSEYARKADNGAISNDEYTKMEKEIEKAKEDAYMETAFTEKECDEIIKGASNTFVQAQKELVHYSNTLAAILADSGVISQKRYYEMKNRWKNYVPLFRVFEENEEVNYGDSTKHMTGSSRDIINPLEGIIKNTYAFIKAAEKNKAKAKLGVVARMSGVGEYIEPVDSASPNDKTTISYLVDGKRKYLKTDPDIVEVINTMGTESSNMFLKAASLPMQIARATATILNPEFAMRNLFRDVGDAVIYSKYGFTPADFMRGFMHAIKKDELYYEFIASGAGQASALSMDRNYTQATIDKMTKTWKQEALSARGILNALQMLGEYSEYGTRIGAYEKARKAEQSKAKQEGRREDIAGITEAALESRDLMDFARGGAASRSWNNVSMFSNVSLQGWNKFYRTFDFSDPKQSKHAKSALLRLFFTGVLPAFVLWAINHDDDRYKELPTWQKEKHWIITAGDKMFRIPKGQDVGLQLFSNWIEKGLNAAYDKDPLTLKKILNPIMNMLPSLLPTAVLPIIEATANYSFFTERTIVPRYQEKLPGKMQYGSDTTSLAKFIGEQTGLSPKKVEHVLFGYTGGLGRAIPNTYDIATGKKQLNTAVEEWPMLRGIMVMPYKNSKTVTDYYEAADSQMKLYNEFKTTGKKPDDFDPKLYARIKAVTPAMQKLSKFERLLADNQTMPVSEKKAKQEKLQQQRIMLSKRAMGK